MPCTLHACSVHDGSPGPHRSSARPAGPAGHTHLHLDLAIHAASRRLSSVRHARHQVLGGTLGACAAPAPHELNFSTRAWNSNSREARPRTAIPPCTGVIMSLTPHSLATLHTCRPIGLNFIVRTPRRSTPQSRRLTGPLAVPSTSKRASQQPDSPPRDAFTLNNVCLETMRSRAGLDFSGRRCYQIVGRVAPDALGRSGRALVCADPAFAFLFRWCVVPARLLDEGHCSEAPLLRASIPRVR